MARPKVKDFKYVSGKKYDGMMGRCYRPTDGSYANYGGRGICIAKDWILDIQNFRKWLVAELLDKNISIEDFVANSTQYQLDRINVDSHYTPSNCRIVSQQVNMRNRRTRKVNIIKTAEGEELCLDFIS
jgi:hypothetical protein